MEPVRKLYDETRRVGQTLIQSAAAGVSTTDIEFNLQAMNNVWTTLTDRVLRPTCLLTYLFCDLPAPSHDELPTVTRMWCPLVS